MKTAKDFLIKNGFKEDCENSFSNGKCIVQILPENYRVEAKDLDYFTPDLTIYGLIGYLTFNNFIDKNYVI
jgi:hypothetical protein